MAWLRRILGAGLLLLVIYASWRLAAANSAPVTVSYIFGEWQAVAHWRALLIAFACGAGITGLALLYEVAKAVLMRRRFRKRLAALESEIHQLRNLPLASEDATMPGGVGSSGGASVPGA